MATDAPGAVGPGAGADAPGAGVGGLAGKVYGYARCSTTEKRQDAERQVADLYAMGATRVVQEYASGAKADREGLLEVMAALAPGDTLCATELSRVTRDLHHLCHVIAEAEAKGVRLRFGGMEFDCTAGPAGPFPRAMLHMMGAFAELERGLAAERIASGLALARANGTRLGRPKKTAADVPLSFRAAWEGFKAGAVGAGDLARVAGVSRPTAAKYSRLLEAEEAGLRGLDGQGALGGPGGPDGFVALGGGPDGR